VKEFVASCEPCQFRNNRRQEESLYPTWSATLFEKIGLDIVHMPSCAGKHYLVIARDDLSGWPEARALAKADSASIAKFLWEEVVCRHGCFGRLVVDGGPENKGFVEEFTRRYRIQRVQISAYHPQANGMIERGHKPIIEALARMTTETGQLWVHCLPAVLFADRTTVHRPTEVTPFELVYGRQAILPVELQHPTWRILDWASVTDRASLLATRARQLQLRNEDIEELALRKQRKRAAAKETFDSTKQLRKAPILEGDLVLCHDPWSDIDLSTARKLSPKWRGPYRVRIAIQDKGTYILEELDNTLLAGTFAGNRLKKFIQRKGILVPIDKDSSIDGTEAENDSTESNSDTTEEDNLATEQVGHATKEVGDSTEVQVLIPEFQGDRTEYIRWDSEN
jgi:hypothetical protein